MRVICNCTNLLGDSLYLLRPMEEFLNTTVAEDVCCIVADPGLPFELFAGTFCDRLPVLTSIDDAKAVYPDAVVLDLNAGRAGELSFRLAREKGIQLHISEAYGVILGCDLHRNIKPPLSWTKITEPLPRTFAAISPFSRSCSRHSGEKPNKTLDDHKWEYLIRYLRRHDLQVKVIAGPNDRLQNCSVPLDDYFTAKNLYELEHFLKSCKLLITLDNGLGHVASLLDTPMISLWPGVSNKDFIAPRFSPATHFVLFDDPNTSTPAQLLQGIRHFTKIILGDSYVETETIRLEDEQAIG